MENITLLDAATGKELHSFNTGDCAKYYWQEPVASDYFAIKSGGVIRVLQPDGTETSLPSVRPQWGAEFTYGPGRLIVGEFPDLDSWDFASEQQYYEKLRELLVDPATNQPGPNFVVSSYSLPSGALSWRREFNCATGEAYYPQGIRQYGDVLYVMEIEDLTAAINVADGLDAAGSVGAEKGVIPSLAIQEGYKLYYQACDADTAWQWWEDTKPVYMYDLATGQDTEVFAAGACPVSGSIAVVPGCLTGSVVASGGAGYSGTPLLMALKLGRDGLPQPGEMQLLTPREEHKDLVARFLSSTDPLADPELMSSIVAKGVNGVERCVARLAAEHAAHWDALLAASLYLDAHKKARQEGSDPLTLVLGKVREKCEPGSAAQLIRWFSDPCLVSLHNRMAGLLAQCRSTAAKFELYGYYKGLKVERHAAPAAQTMLRLPGTIEDGLSGYYNAYTDSGIYAAATDTQGVKYLIFPAEGLLTDRDLYIAVDSQGDGEWDEVLATGLQDISFYHCHPGGPCGPGPKGKLELSVVDGVARIKHHQPVMETVTYGEGEDRWESLEMTGARRMETAVALSSLRLDTDADGLTDVLEKLLFLDPASPDTDGDGLLDASDAAPRANPEQMGRLERGIARALDFFFQEGRRYWWANNMERQEAAEPLAGQPHSARYVLVHGCGPVSICGDKSTYSICLSTKQEREFYNQALNNYAPMSMMKIGWSIPDMDPAQSWASSVYADSYNPAQHAGENYMYDSDWEQYTAWQCDMIVNVQYWLSGFIIAMVEIDGEYYPREVFMTWIS